MSKEPKLEGTKKLMAALVRMPPKPHEEMKLRQRPSKLRKSTKDTRSK